MIKSVLNSLFNARLLVGFLGERAQYAWWPTSFYEPSSRLFLEPVFAKTYRLAQYRGVVEAARRVHDEHLNVGSYHLFRLPEEVEQDLHGLFARPEANEILPGLDDTDSALSQLRDVAGAAVVNGVGPTAVGQIEAIQSAETIQLIAAAYLSAFTQGVRSYPYLVR